MADVIEQQEQGNSEVVKPKRSQSGVWFGIIILLIIASITGAGFYLFTQLRDRQEGLGGEVESKMLKKLADYQDQITAMQNQLASLEANIGNKDAHYSKTLTDFSDLHNEKLDNTRKELNEAIQHIQRQLGKTRGDWLVADAEYLLSVANERLHLVGDLHTTLEALEAADQRLRESGDTGVYKVREQIAKDIALIHAIKQPDIVGMYVMVQSLESQVDSLALLLPYAGKPLTPVEAQTSASETEQGLLDKATEHLHGLVTIRHTDQAITEILTPEQAKFIREQLRVKLEMIKIALVERNQSIFSSGVNDAKTWIEQHFLLNEQSKPMLSALEKLSVADIESDYPDISTPVKMLRDLAKLRLEADKAGEQPEAAKEKPKPIAAEAAPTPAPISPPAPSEPRANPTVDEHASPEEQPEQ